MEILIISMISKNEFASIYEDYFEKIYSYIFFRVWDALISEDIVSLVFFKALKNLEKFDSSKWKMSTWLYAIASNALIDYFRKNDENLCVDDFENVLYDEQDFWSEIDFEINYSKVMDCFDKLPLKAQEIISLRIFSELTFSEIAEIINLSESWVKMSYARWIDTIRNSVNLLLLILFILFK